MEVHEWNEWVDIVGNYIRNLLMNNSNKYGEKKLTIKISAIITKYIIVWWILMAAASSFYDWVSH